MVERHWEPPPAGHARKLSFRLLSQGEKLVPHRSNIKKEIVYALGIPSRTNLAPL